MKARLPILLAVILAPALAFGTVLVDDTFSDGDRAKTGVLDADWWTSSSSAGIEVSAGSLGLVTGSSGRGIHGTFAPQTLAIGDTITATYTFSTPATVGTGFSTGLKIAMLAFNDPGLAADLASSSSSAQPLYFNLPGYMADYDVNTGATADITVREHLVNTTGRLLGTTAEWVAVGSSSPDAGYVFAPSTEYVGVFSITRTGLDSVDVSSSLSQGGNLMDSQTVSDASGIADSFGMLAFWANSNNFGSSAVAGTPDNGLDFSHIVVEYVAIPEPTTMALVLVGLALGVCRRRR